MFLLVLIKRDFSKAKQAAGILKCCLNNKLFNELYNTNLNKNHQLK